MLVDHISNYYLYKDNNEKVDKAIEYIKNTNLEDLTSGIHVVEGENLFFNLIEYETKAEVDRFWESHNKYIDIHYLLEGKEFVGYELFERMSIKKDYDEQDDYFLLEGDLLSKVKLQKGDFMICYPKDVHMTGIMVKNPEKVRKLVFKVKI